MATHQKNKKKSRNNKKIEKLKRKIETLAVKKKKGCELTM
jgi:hypothetical protein